MNSRKVCVITGAAGGIGREVVRKYLENDYQTILVDMSLEKMADVLNWCNCPKGQADCYRTDISNEAEVEKLVGTVMSEHGRIDVLVNAAGICGRYAPAAEYGYDNFRRIYEVNVFGSFLMIEKILPVMVNQNGGVITNFGSVSGMRGYSLEIGYGSSKWAVIGMSETVANEYGKYHIRCNSVSPGWVATEMMKQTMADYEREGKANFEISPMNRAAEPSEIADVVYYLSSDQASYINGANIVIDGGKTTH